MKIYIYYEETDKPWGGSNSFIKAFKKYLKEKKGKKIEIVTDIDDDYDVFFMNTGSKAPGVQIEINEIKKIKKYGYTKPTKRLFRKNPCKKIVYRLDGLRAIYNNQWDKMDELQLQASRLADYLIFQSRHCLESFRGFGYEDANYSIVYNGVDQRIFNTHDKKFLDDADKLKVFSCNWSNNPRKGYSVIARFSEIEGIESYFVGNWPEQIDKKRVICLPPMKQEELAKYYKNCDVFLHAANDDPCPNVVLEALSCGLPVIYHDSGGTPEIAGNYGIPLPKNITTETICDLIETMKGRYPQFVENIKNDMKKFAIEQAAREYVSIFYSLVEGKT